MKKNVVYNGDCLRVLRTFEDKSIDCVITDPPYGFSFMNKDWDKAVPSVEIWKECLRVLKDGAFMFVMSAPRQDVLSQMIVRLGQAGFRMGFTSIVWAYASGFPKAENIGKMVDKRLGVEREVIGKEKIDVGIQSGSMHSGRSVEVVEMDKTIATSKEAKSLDGSYGGFQPKPAVEIIIVCMKPLSEKTYVEQALKNGKGVTWLDGCRIPIDPIVDASQIRTMKRHQKIEDDGWGMNNNNSDNPQVVSPNGRFPANLIVSDDVLNNGKIFHSAGNKEEHGKSQMSKGDFIFGRGLGGHEVRDLYGTVDSFSRYFDLDKWWEKKVEELPEEVKRTFPFLICPKASKNERNKGCENLVKGYITEQNKWSENDYRKGKGEKTTDLKGNFHPTVKPLKLMSYLITLGSREGDMILDPFVGSGTVCLAAKTLNRECIGIEISKEYCNIASARVGCKIMETATSEQSVEHCKAEPYVKQIEDGCGNCKYKKACKRQRGKCNMWAKEES